MGSNIICITISSFVDLVFNLMLGAIHLLISSPFEVPEMGRAYELRLSIESHGHRF